MFTSLLHINAILLIQLLFVLFGLSAIVIVVADPFINDSVRKYRKILVFGIVLVLVFRIPFWSGFFHGLEYEDSYVYSVAGRGMTNPQLNRDARQSPYLVDVCVMGSLDDCEISQTYSGHYLGLPALVRALDKFFGYDVNITNYIALGSAVLATAIIVLIAVQSGISYVAIVIGVIIFASTPILAVWGATSSAEPLSALFVVITIFCWLRCALGTTSSWTLRFAYTVALGIAFLLAIVIKRENLLLPVLLPLCSWIVSPETPISRLRNRQLLTASAVAAAAILFGLYEMRIADTLTKETTEFGGFPFGLHNVLAVLIPFARSFVQPAWYMAAPIFVLLGLAVMLGRRSEICIPFLIVGYLALYVSHVRSFYQLHGVVVSPDQALRYSTNLFCIGSVAGAHGFDYILRRISTISHSRKVIYAGVIAVGVYLLAAFALTTSLRWDAVGDERTLRIEPALRAISTASKLGAAYIATDEPLIVQMYAPSATRVVDSHGLDDGFIIRKLRNEAPSSNLLIVYLSHKMYSHGLDTERYRDVWSSDNDASRIKVYDDSKVELGYISVGKLTNASSR